MNNGKRTILFVMSRLPFPAVSGRKTSLYHYCRILSEEIGCRLVVASFLEKGDDPEHKPDFIDRLVILPKATAAASAAHILKDSIVKKKKPMQVSLYWNSKANKIVERLVQEERPDAVIGDMVRSAEYIRNLNTYRISDLDDLISLRYKRQSEADMKGINPYGAFLYTVPKFLRKIMSVNAVKNYVVKNEISLLEKYELDIGRVCEKTVFVAESEAEKFNRELGMEKAISVPIGVDTDFFLYGRECAEDNFIGFLGAMNVAHNENAARHFINDIFPLVLEKVPDAKFLIVGCGASEDLLKLSCENIFFTGLVKDVRVCLRKCKVCVCPMTFGSGIKTKNLEIMSMGMPIVTTSVGAENIGAVNNSDWIIADDSREFAEAVISLLSDKDKRTEIGKNAGRFIRRSFTWDKAKKRLEMLFGEIKC